jgi:hypothetical protein
MMTSDNTRTMLDQMERRKVGDVLDFRGQRPELVMLEIHQEADQRTRHEQALRPHS